LLFYAPLLERGRRQPSDGNNSAPGARLYRSQVAGAGRRAAHAEVAIGEVGPAKPAGFTDSEAAEGDDEKQRARAGQLGGDRLAELLPLIGRRHFALAVGALNGRDFRGDVLDDHSARDGELQCKIAYRPNIVF